MFRGSGKKGQPPTVPAIAIGEQWSVPFVDAVNAQKIASNTQRTPSEAVGDARDYLLQGYRGITVVGPAGRKLEVDFLQEAMTASGSVPAPVRERLSRAHWLVLFTDVVTGLTAVSTRPSTRHEAVSYGRWLTGQGCAVMGIFNPDGRQISLEALRNAEPEPPLRLVAVNRDPGGARIKD
jgi:hypothetical protein